MPFIILDRDGVINYDSDEYIKTPEEWVPIPYSLEAIAHLNRAGYQILIATNQSGIARGYYDLDTLDLIHEKFMRELAAVGGCIQEIFFCPHHPDENCPCRKPKLGMFRQMQKKYTINMAETFYIGDSLKDMQAAKQMGCIPLLVLTGNGSRDREQYAELKTIACFDNLAKAVDHILSQEKHSHAR